MKTFTFRVTMTADEDGWLVRCPQLEGWGAVTWGRNEAEALRFIEEVLGMVWKSCWRKGVKRPWLRAMKELPASYLVNVSV
jgi:predicted RNase H-like HicB family nuclease